jgi:MFS family permease
VILGLGTGGAGQAPLALATDATIDEPHGLSMGVYRLFGDVGFVVGPILMGFIADNSNLYMPFYVTTAIIIVNVVLVQLFAKETYSRKKADSMVAPLE